MITGTLLNSVAGLIVLIATPLEQAVDRLLRPVVPAALHFRPSFGEFRAGVIRTVANGLAYGSLEDQDRGYLAITVAGPTCRLHSLGRALP